MPKKATWPNDTYPVSPEMRFQDWASAIHMKSWSMTRIP